MSDYPMLISNKLHSFRNFSIHNYDEEDTLPATNQPATCRLQ